MWSVGGHTLRNVCLVQMRFDLNQKKNLLVMALTKILFRPSKTALVKLFT
jgi:hypothetical protein